MWQIITHLLISIFFAFIWYQKKITKWLVPIIFTPRVSRICIAIGADSSSCERRLFRRIRCSWEIFIMYVRNVKRCKTHKTDFPKGWTNNTMEKTFVHKISFLMPLLKLAPTNDNERYKRDFSQPMAMQNGYAKSVRAQHSLSKASQTP